MPNPIMNRRVVLGGINLQSETKAWLAVLATRPSTAVVSAVDNFIKASKISGNWALMDRFWLFAQDNQTNARVSIANPTATVITEVNTPTWTSLQGYTGNGSNMYLNTNYNFSSSSSQYTQNSGSVGFYSRTSAANADMVDIGALATASTSIVTNIKSSTGSYNWNVNSSAATVIGGANANSQGLYQIKRTASNSQEAFKNGVSFGTSANVSSALPNFNCYILAWNNNGTASQFSTRQLSMAFIGSGSINSLSLYNDFQNNVATPLGFAV